MELLQFYCGHCGALLQVRQDLAGKRGRCPQCRQLNVVPFPRSDGQTARAKIADPAPGSTPGTAPGDIASAPPPAGASGRPAVPGGAARTVTGGGYELIEGEAAESGSGMARLDTDFGYSSSAAQVPKPPPLPTSTLADAATAASERASNAMTATRPVGSEKGSRGGKGLSSNIPAILAAMLLATMVLPWHLISRPPIEGRNESSIEAPFAWQLLAEAQPIEWAYLIGMWLVGGLTMIILALFGGLVRGMVLLFLGLVGLVLAFGLHASQGNSLAVLENSWVFEVSVGWRLFWGVTLVVLGMNLFALHWRAGCGRVDVVRWSVVGVSGLGVAWMLICTILVLSSLPPADRRPDWIITPFWGLVLVCLAWLSGCGLLLADGIRGRGHLAAYSALPLYLGLLLAGLLVMITPVLAAATGGMVLRSLNLVMFGVGGALGLAVYGGTETAMELTPKRGGGTGTPATG